MKLADRKAYQYWENFRKQLKKDTVIDLNESATERKKRIERLEGDFEAWAQYYFPNYYRAKPAKFHVKASKRWLKNTRIYEVRAWSRELAKSTRAMMEDLYLLLTGEARVKLLVSSSADNAVKLATPYRINLESNNRIINDYGEQQSIGDWTENKFTSKMGFVIAAIGARQSPRGFKLEEVRPDIIDIDDIDTDEECRNPEIIKKKWDWIEQALIPTVSISGNKRIRFNGNVIAQYCCITEAMKMADHVDVINIRDKNGKSTWPAKNSEEDIDWILSKISYFSQQKEYYNNPVTEGTVFKEMYWKKMPDLRKYPFLVCYIDLSYKSGKKNDYKYAVLMGKYKTEYHILKAWGKQGTTRALASGLEDINRFVGDRTVVYWYAEENFMQDIIKKELHDNLQTIGSNIVISADSRAKKEKFFRIEAALEPLNSNGRLFLNEAEKDNPHMQTLRDQFIALAPGSRVHDDAPDASEGAKYIIDQKITSAAPPIFGKRRRNTKRY